MAALLMGAAIPALAMAASPPAAQAAGAEGRFGAEVAEAKGAMMSNPDVALAHAKAATVIGKSLSGERAVVAEATGEWLQGEALSRLNHPDRATPITDAALAVVAAHAPNTKLHADLLKSRAQLAVADGQPQIGLPMLHRAFALYQQLGEARSQAIVLQLIGQVYYDARDYPRALNYYEQANDAFSADPILKLSAHNYRGNAFKEMGDFAKAEHEYALALATARSMDSPVLEVRILNNLASAQQLQGKLATADATASQGLSMATGAAAEWRPYLWGVKAQVAYARGDAATAARLLERTFAGVDLKTSPMSYRDFHSTARYVYEALGRDKEALHHLAAFTRLNDEARDVAASVNSALMSARFDAANQEARIAKLKVQEAERGIKLARSQQQLRAISLITLIGGLASAAVIGAILFAFAAARRSRREIHSANLQLTHVARHDALTGLPNRAYFRELFEEALNQGGDSRCALLLIDLDRFKAVNDTLGHAAGDELLVAVARRLEAVVGSSGHAARLGGDEFAIIVPDVTQSMDVLARRVITALSAPVLLSEGLAEVGATVSIAIGPVDGENINTLIQNADLALYRAKDAGRGRHARYEPRMRREAQDRRQLEADLRDAMANNQLALAYQPIVDATSGEIMAYEALLRWDHPTLGSIPPAVFVPIAEETRLINQLGSWVLRSACAQAMTWPSNIKVAVNVSTLQVESESLTSTVINALASSGLPAERLELEMTESVFLRQGGRSEGTLDRLRSLGVQLALDDFGTGYSSLGYLPRASFSKVKIDRSFVELAAGGCQVSTAVIRSIVALAHGLGMQITAEGVETKSETALMRKLGCTQLQGYLIGRPEIAGSTSTPAAPEEDLPKPARRKNRRAA